MFLKAPKTGHYLHISQVSPKSDFLKKCSFLDQSLAKQFTGKPYFRLCFSSNLCNTDGYNYYQQFTEDHGCELAVFGLSIYFIKRAIHLTQVKNVYVVEYIAFINHFIGLL